MQILKNYPAELTKKQKYDLTMSPKIRKMSNATGSVLDVSAWCLYEDADNDGELHSVLSILTPEGEIFATNSATFQRDFAAMCELFGDGGVDRLEIISGQSKAGREFVTCAYAGE